MAENSQTGTKPTNGIYGNQIASIYDAGKPIYVLKLCSRFGMQFANFYRTFELIGREDPIEGSDTNTWDGWEENRYEQGIKVLADVADPGAGATTTFQLDPTYIGTAASGYAFYGRVGETVTIPGTNVQARISAITGSGTATVYITLMPVSQTSNIGALTAGTVLSITNGAYADGTAQPTGVRTGHTKRTFMVQIFKETYGLEGKEFTTSKCFETFDNNGNEVPYSVVTDLSVQTQVRLDAKINGAFILGQQRTNPNMIETTPAGNTNYINYTQGLIPTITANGQTTVIPSGSFDVEDMDDIGLYMRGQGVTKNIALMAMGANRYNEVENEIVDYRQGNGEDLLKSAGSSLMGNDPDDMMLHVGFTAFKKGNYTYLFKIIDELSNPEGLGRTGYDLNQYAFILPIEDIRNPMGKGTQKNIATRYIKKGSYSRKFEMWSEGAAGGDVENYTTSIDQRLYYMRVHLGFQILGANQMQIIKP
jgi:hypothetical protein